VERTDQLAGRGKVSVLPRRDFQSIGHGRIVVHGVGHASRFSRIEPQRLSFGWPQIQAQQGIELTRIPDGCDRSQPEYSVGKIDARAVVRFDAVEVDLDDARRRQFPSQDRRLNIFNRRFLDPEFGVLCRRQRWYE